MLSNKDEDQVRRLVSPYVIADKAPTTAIQRQRQLVLGMVVPFERYFRDAAVVNPQRAAMRIGNSLELGLHEGTCSDIHSMLAVRIVSIVGLSASPKHSTNS